MKFNLVIIIFLNVLSCLLEGSFQDQRSTTLQELEVLKTFKFAVNNSDYQKSQQIASTLDTDLQISLAQDFLEEKKKELKRLSSVQSGTKPASVAVCPQEREIDQLFFVLRKQDEQRIKRLQEAKASENTKGTFVAGIVSFLEIFVNDRT